MNGRRVGLPTVRQYAQYFGGNLTYARGASESDMVLVLRHDPDALEELCV